MVYIATIEDQRSLIFEGPVAYNKSDTRILTSSNLRDVRYTWEYRNLPDVELEWPALKRNAIDALQRIDRYALDTTSERKILDFGAGWGHFLAVAKSHDWIAYGLEPRPDPAVYARAKFGLQIITDTLHEDTFPSQFFDAVTSFQVFEHLPFPRENVQHLYKILRPGAIILIEVPNFDTWSMRVLKARHRHFVKDHLNFFSSETLAQFLADNGFRVMDRYYPTRHLSVRYLVDHWFARYLPARAIDMFQKALSKTKLWEQMIALNFGDIVSVIGCKT